jgi:DNA replication and repair protein RecF
VRITDLRLFQHRNFSQASLSFSSAANLFFGKNGQGKTNLLEAIYLLAYGRSFRTGAPRDWIKFGENLCRVEGTVEHGGLERNLTVLVTRSEKKLLVHQKNVALDEFVGTLHALAFTSAQLSVIRGGPVERRSFLDRAMITAYPGHLIYLAVYERALRQRNRFLMACRDGGGRVDDALLESWNTKLSQDGSRILWNRRNYVAAMKAEIPRGMLGTEDLQIEYISTVPLEGHTPQELEAKFRATLSRSRSLDLKSGFTSVGPHRDDLKLFINGKALADFGSAGQQRSGLILLYLAQMEIHRRIHGFYPVFLMDDVEAELDAERLKIFLGYLSERTQTFLATAKPSFLPALGCEVRRFEIDAGRSRLLPG